jgi:hypothetical protein
MTRSMLLVCCVASLTAGCGGGGKPAGATGPDHGTPADTRSELQIRRDAACEALGPRITQCAIEDARATMTAEELAKLDLEQTAPKHTEEFVTACKTQQLSSRQVRVYEVCVAEESECEPLMACLDNVHGSSSDSSSDGSAAP